MRAQLLAKGGAIAAVAAGLVDGDWTIVLAVPASIIIVSIALGVAEALHIGSRAKLLGWMGLRDPQVIGQSDPRED